MIFGGLSDRDAFFLNQTDDIRFHFRGYFISFSHRHLVILIYSFFHYINFDQVAEIWGPGHFISVTVIEGMHRCAAYSVSVFDGDYPKTEFYIALGIGRERWLSKLLYDWGLM